MVDEEDPGVSQELVHVHLATCANCRLFQQRIEGTVRLTRLTAAASVPDQTAAIMSGVPRTPRRGADVLRGILVGFGCLELFTGLTALLARVDGASTIHQTRELGAFAVAVGVGSLLAAFRPVRIAGLVPVLVMMAFISVVAGVFDVAAGQTSVLAESHHVVELAATSAVWWLSRPRPGGFRASSALPV